MASGRRFHDHPRREPKFGLSLFLAFVCGSCGGAAVDLGHTVSKTTVTPVQSSSTSKIALDTTIPDTALEVPETDAVRTDAVPVTPEKALREYATSVNARDYSRISNGKCGTIAIAIRQDPPKQRLWNNLAFLAFDWNEYFWREVGSSFGEIPGEFPVGITSHDFDGDGINDFLITFSDDGTTTGRMFGGIFTYPPYAPTDNGCDWGWVEISDGDGVSTSIDSLKYDETTGLLRAVGTARGRGRTSGVLTYNADEHWFSFVPDDEYIDPNSLLNQTDSSVSPGENDIANRCLGAMSGMIMVSVNGRKAPAYDRAGTWGSLTACRRSDWIRAAERMRSKYSTMADYRYYGDQAVLLKGADAAKTLDWLCEQAWATLQQENRDTGTNNKKSSLLACR